MFDKIAGLPMHPLVIHAVVVGIPLTALLAVLFAVPRTRRWARWAFGLAVLGSTAATFVAKESGEALLRNFNVDPTTTTGAYLMQHSFLADQLFLIMIGFAVIGVATVALAPRRDRDGAVVGGSRPVGLVLVPLMLVAAAVAVIWVVRVGDLGARAVWGG